jgi:hypothetical protein
MADIGSGTREFETQHTVHTKMSPVAVWYRLQIALRVSQ